MPVGHRYRAAILGLCLSLAFAVAARAQFNVNDAFLDNETPNGTETNPFGPYRYGFSLTPSNPAAFVLFSAADHSDSIVGPAMQGYIRNNNNSTPSLFINTSAVAAPGFGSTTVAPHQLVLHPGGPGPDSYTPPFAAAVLRYVVPQSGTYTITGDFQDLDQGSTIDDVLRNGVSILPGPITTSSTFTEVELLSAGDFLDFVVTSASDGINFDSVGLRANIVPEPTSLVIVAISAAAMTRRRKPR